MPTDIFNREIKVGTVVAYVSSAAKLDVGVVTKIRNDAKGRLIGYAIEYPYDNKIEGMDKRVIFRKKTLRAGRELIAVPASWLSGLRSAQANCTTNFASMIQYLEGRYNDG